MTVLWEQTCQNNASRTSSLVDGPADRGPQETAELLDRAKLYLAAYHQPGIVPDQAHFKFTTPLKHREFLIQESHSIMSLLYDMMPKMPCIPDR
jgi:hypothetical protein